MVLVEGTCDSLVQQMVKLQRIPLQPLSVALRGSMGFCGMRRSHVLVRYWADSNLLRSLTKDLPLMIVTTSNSLRMFDMELRVCLGTLSR